MKLSLTDKTMRSLELPAKGQRTYRDSILDNFAVRVSQGGTKTFVVIHGRNRQVTTLGRYPTVSLADARTAAKRLLAKRTLDKHLPVAVRASQALEEYLAHVTRKNRPKTAYQYKRTLNKHWLAMLRHVHLGDVSPQDVHRRLDRLADTPSEQHHALTNLKLFFSWCLKRNYLDKSPVANISLPQGKARERVLADHELVALWKASGDSTFGNIVRLLMLTGMRRGEVGALEWSDMLGDVIVLPPDRTKNKREHVLPMTAVLEGQLTRVDKLHDRLLFPARGKDTSVSGWQTMKNDFDKKAGVTGWTLHDLRRTFATNLAALGTPVHITERLLNHKSGTISGVAAIYNRHQYVDECRAALEGWHDRVMELVTQSADGQSPVLAV